MNKGLQVRRGGFLVSLVFGALFLPLCAGEQSVNKTFREAIPSGTLWEQDVEMAKGQAKPWSLLTYIQADNDLAPFADYNIKNMQLGILDDNALNMLVQWDQPDNDRTWRYRIVRGGRIEDESLSAEMGHNPAQELVDAMKWVVQKFPAERYGIILWNHGSGVHDYRSAHLNKKNMPRHIQSWIEIPGLAHAPMPAQKTKSVQKKGACRKPQVAQEDKGILYDDSQDTCLDNQGMYNAFRAIANGIGRKIDLIGMDACLMAMIEVAYQIRYFADIFVASQQTEPGEGWNYRSWLAALSARPMMDSFDLSETIVQAYKEQYRYHPDAQDYTQSAIRLSVIDDLKANIDAVAIGMLECVALDAETMIKIIGKARRASVEMYAPEYIDLHSFYTAMLGLLQRTSPKSSKFLQNAHRPLSRPMTPEFQATLNKLSQWILAGVKMIPHIVTANAAGPALANVRGISICFPKKGRIHNSYYGTLFAQESPWIDFLKNVKV